MGGGPKVWGGVKSKGGPKIWKSGKAPASDIPSPHIFCRACIVWVAISSAGLNVCLVWGNLRRNYVQIKPLEHDAWVLSIYVVHFRNSLCRPVRAGSAGGAQINWAYLNQVGQIMPTTVLLIPQDFQTLLRPCYKITPDWLSLKYLSNQRGCSLILLQKKSHLACEL